MPIASYPFKVEGQQIGFNNRLKLSGLSDVLQIAAWRHAEQLGFGLSEMMANDNRTWAMSRIHIQIDKPAKHGDELIVKTWPKKKDRIFAFRDWFVEQEGEIIARATSTYLLIDLTTRRPISLTGLYDDALTEDGLHAIEEPAERIHEIEETEFKTIDSSYTDLDVNDHVNNVRYLDWAQSLMPASFWKERKVDSVLVNYFNEVHSDSSIALSGSVNGNTLKVLGKVNEKEMFKVELHFSKN
jgi:acyl-ACP thioesterase